MDDNARQYDRVIREALVAHSDLGDAAREVERDADLYAIGLTSLHSVRVLLAVEDALDVEIPEQHVGRALFSSIGHFSGVLLDITGATSGAER
ncbi:phosphopantetheine-binding protein [Streptomyces sp. NPDC048258]|uniref:phosphopantetheine-binding protein n=1 Tax=Streptomyces sp. NPDC048258 TaxID=3365527 RepID=UPI00371251E1